MANFCPNCGSSVNSNAVFCPSCGASLNAANNSSYNNNNTTYQQPVDNTSSTVGTVLGTLVAVNLIGGLTRNLYYYGGRYYHDPYCRRPFMDMHMILGRPRPMPRPLFGRPPMHRPPMGGPRGPMGGGPRGGGPRGRR